MRSLALALVAAPTLALAGPTEAPVIGGSPTTSWPDAVALLWNGEARCTGTLIAPDVVLTAAHCVLGGKPDSVLVGASALSRASEGETLAVAGVQIYPSDLNGGLDVALVYLSQSSHVPPRAVAGGWAAADIQNGARVTIAGFGTTDRDGTVKTDALIAAETTITDAGCTISSGCKLGARPNGELGAGGKGIDTCPGDSGGPLYLMTEYGAFLAGVTSRPYDNARYACSEGGIYTRPDKLDGFFGGSGVSVLGGPAPMITRIDTSIRNLDEIQITPNDPKSTKHTYAFRDGSEYTNATVTSTGLVRVCRGGTAKSDVVVTVTDANDTRRSVDVFIQLFFGDPSKPDGPCDVTEDSGCCNAGGDPSGTFSLAAFVALIGYSRRRWLRRG